MYQDGERYRKLFHEHMHIECVAEPGDKVDELIKLAAFCSIKKGFFHIHVKQMLFHVVYNKSLPKIEKNIEKVIGYMSGYVGLIMVSTDEISSDEDVAKIIKMTFNHEEDWRTTDVNIVAIDDEVYTLNMEWDDKELAKSARKYGKYFDYIPRAQQC